MSWDSASMTSGCGFKFEVPVPLPLLGHRSGFTVRNDLFSVAVLVELKPVKSRIGGLSFSGGICYHDRDRFGLFAGSLIELRIDQTADRLVSLDIFAPLAAFERDGQTVCALGPGDRGLHLCASMVNLLVDIQTTAFSTHWVPHVTPDDLLELSLIDWSDPANPKGMGYMAGVDGVHKFRFGRESGFPAFNQDRIRHILKILPLDLWEELIHATLRDLEVGRSRSTLMHACLAVETYCRRVIELNPSPNRDGRYADRSLKELVSKRTCLPLLLGYSLDSSECPDEIREHYQRISALRDSIMHKGELKYRWPPRATSSVVVSSPLNVRAHVFSALSVIWHISSALESSGKVTGNRGVVPAPADILSGETIAHLRAKGASDYAY